jgi:phosphatidylserine decarboxylase
VTDHDQVVTDLRSMLDEQPDLAEQLRTTLAAAGDRARSELNRTLYEALEWPREVEEYCRYLRGFIRWIPQQTDAEAWKVSAPGERYAKEVSDRLAHFYFLVNEPIDEEGNSISGASSSFRDWLTRFAREWGSFLDSPESFSEEILEQFLTEAPEYTIEESLKEDGRPNTPSGWLTFNQFFARELNPGLRPIASPGDNRVVTSPADCTFVNVYGIDAESIIPEETLKQTHRYGSIEQLLEGSHYVDAFAGGTFVHYQVPPSSYHRYHLPVSGLVKESFLIHGRVYMEVQLQDGDLAAVDSAKTGYEFTQTRGAVILDTAESDHGDVGLVAVIPVGMSHVSSVNLTTVEDTHARKGEQFGFFQFGGSDIILLFQQSVTPHVDTNAGFCKTGTVVARC